MNCSTPGSSVFHYLPEFAQIHALNWWCYLTILSSAAHFSFCLLCFPASGSFPMSLLFTSGVKIRYYLILKCSGFLCIHGYSVYTKWLLFLVSYETKGNVRNKKDSVTLETQSRICWSWILQGCYGVGETELGVALAAVYRALLLCTRHSPGCFTCLISDPHNSFVISPFLQRRKLDGSQYIPHSP